MLVQVVMFVMNERWDTLSILAGFLSREDLGACLRHRFSSGLGSSPRCRSALCLAAGSAGNVLLHTLRRPWRKKLPPSH